jgi:hemerythrin-like metal-binding protein
VLDFLQFYAGWHFQREEEYMEKFQCAAAEENKRQHAVFLKDFGSFYAEWQTGGMKPELARETFLGLIRWIGNHIQKVDTQLYLLVKKE